MNQEDESPLVFATFNHLSFSEIFPLRGFGGPEKDWVLFCGTATSYVHSPLILHAS